MVALDDDDAALTCVGGGAKAALGAIEAIAKQFEANRAAAGILERLEKLERADAERSRKGSIAWNCRSSRSRTT